MATADSERLQRISAILFDKDGTLFHFEATWARWCAGLVAHLAEGDGTRAERLASALGYDLGGGRFLPHSPVIAGTAEDILDALMPEMPGGNRARLWDLIAETTAVTPQVEAAPLLPLLTELRNLGLRLGVATNDTERVAVAHLEANGTLELFDFVAGYDSGHGAKPGPGMALAFCDAVGIPPAAVAMVGDSAHDLECARAAGLARIAVLTGPAPAETLAPLADLVLGSIAELRPLAVEWSKRPAAGS